jgi:hypothetical protein
MAIAGRQWWWFRNQFYVHSDDQNDPKVIKGLILQMEQRKAKQREKALRTAREYKQKNRRPRPVRRNCLGSSPPQLIGVDLKPKHDPRSG